MKTLQLLVLLGLTVVLTAAVVELPPRGDLSAPASKVENALGKPLAGAYYIQNAYPDAKTPNFVTVILADYRGFDTLGETVVVFAGGLACLYILRRRKS